MSSIADTPVATSGVPALGGMAAGLLPRVDRLLCHLVAVPAAVIVLAEIGILLAGVWPASSSTSPSSGQTSWPPSSSSGWPCWGR
ncbi:hypothetical protein [Roseomonas sp. TAS13]|uniref:hypothetical protein n=1 Tax=Roseomonas sp. TAS13 TaxID=1926319 RepID=UPI00209A88B8|nr:hypothetical protein [Roseomonas sp. TAS13]